MTRRQHRQLHGATIGLTLLALTLHTAPHSTPLVECGGEYLSYERVAARRGVSLELANRLLAHGMTSATLCAVDDDLLRRIIRRATLPKPDSPDEYLRWRLLSLRDENGVVRENGLAAAKAHVDMMRAASLPGMPIAGITRETWAPIGPGNIGGRIRSLLIHPTTPTVMWAGSVGGGIWKTTNGGAAWFPLDDFMANIAVATLVMHPGNPNEIYAGTGEGYYNADGIRGAGIFKSTDGGTTWTQLAATSTAPGPGMSAEDFHFVNRLALSPNGATLLAATRTGIYRSTNGGTSFTRATLVGGAAIPPTNGITDIDFHPSDSTRAVAGTFSGTGFYSTDGGATWAASSGLPASGVFDRVETAFAPSDGSIVYASAHLFSNPGGALGRIYKSTDSGQTFGQVHENTTVLGGQGWYDNVLWVSPADPNYLVWGGIDLWRSTNGAVTFTQISDWSSWAPANPSSAHADHHVIVAHPGFNGGTNQTVWFGTDGGVYVAADISSIPACTPFIGSCRTGWSELNNGLGITQFYGGAGHPGTGRITGGTQDNGTLHYNPAAANPGENWTWPFGGDGGFSAYDSADANYFYGEYVFAQIHRNTTGGVFPSSYIFNGLSDANTSNAEFIAAFRLDPNENNRLLVGTVRLWRTNNAKAPSPTWESIKPSLGTNDKISAIGVAPGNSNVIFAGHNSGRLYKTTQGADVATNVLASWTVIDDNGASNPLPARRITRVTVDPHDNEVVYVTFGGFSGDNVYKSINGGGTWADITGAPGAPTALPEVPVRSVVVSPLNPNWIYAGTEVGIFASSDGGATWGLPHDGPSNVSVDELFFLGNQRLVAVTHGRGMFSTHVGSAPTISSIPAQATASGVPVSANFTIADEDTPLASLTLSGASTNTALLPNAAITFGGTGANRSVMLAPTAGAVGVTTVTVTVSDGVLSASTSFTLTVTAPPSLAAIPDQIGSVGSTVSVSLTLSDPDTPVGSLTLSGSSSNQAVIPDAALSFGGSGASRTLSMVPAAPGTATITVVASDGSATASRSFTLSVNAGPTISAIADRTTPMGVPATANFTVADPDTPLGTLTLSGMSSNQALLPNAGIGFGGAGANRSVALTPTAGAFGSATVTVTVSDGTLSASAAFTLTVTAPPALAAIPDQTGSSGSAVVVALTLSDPDTPAGSLTVSGTSSNPAVLPNAAISFGGAGGSRTATLMPIGGGTTIVTIVVSDGTAMASRSFALTVTTAPANLAAVVRGNLVSFTWTPSSTPGVTGYALEAGISAGGTLVSLPVGNVTFFETTAPSGVFFVRVRALVGGAPDLASNEIEVRIGDAALPGAPANLLANLNGAALTLAWHTTDVGGTRTGLSLQAAFAASPNVILAELPLPPGAESFAITAPPGSYSLRVVASGPAGISPPSNAVVVTVPGTCAVPATPRNLTARVTGPAVTMSWDLGPEGTAAPASFVLEAGLSPGAADAAVLNTMARVIATAAPPGTYHVRVRAVSACGASANTADVAVTVP